MKDFIKKISKGSKLAFFLEILLLAQIIAIITLAITNESIDRDEYCSKHGYSHHGDIVVPRSDDYEE